MTSLYRDLNPVNNNTNLNQNQLQRNSLSNTQQLISLFKNSSNPLLLLNTLIKTNPRYQNIYSLIQKSNKTPKLLFYALAQLRGIDPNSILSLF